MANEPTEAEVQEIIDTAAQQEIARIAGAPEPEPKTTDNAGPQAAEVRAPVEQTQEVEEPSLADQVKAIRDENKQLRKLLDTTNGRLGQEVQFIKRRLDTPPERSTPNLDDVFSRINIEDPAFAELKEEFPELAGQFVTALNKALTRQESAGQKQESKGTTQDNASKETRVETQAEGQRVIEQQTANNPALDRMALDTLQTKHPDFLELAHFSADEIAPGMVSVKWKDKQFGDWLDTMPSDVKEAILIGGSVETPSASQILRISDIMTEYKKQIADTAKTTTTESDENKREGKPKPKVDLRRTLMPNSHQSNTKAVLTDEEIIEQAKKAEMLRIANGG